MERSIIAQGRRGVVAASLGIALFLSGCGGGDGSGSDLAAPTACTGVNDCGGVMIGITDADGDFVRYVVAIQSMTLDRQDGAEVETLPSAVNIDLAQFTDLTELLSSATVPLGVYTGAHLRLDYSNADIAVERDGETVAGVAVDANGTPLTTVDVAIQFDNQSQLTVRPGSPALLGVDFDLTASNAVDLTTTPVTVTAQPFLLASVDPADGKMLHVNGPLVSTDASGSTYNVHLRPFHRRNDNFGDVTLSVSDTTTYEVNGTGYTGADGLAALAQLPAGTPTLAQVTENVADRSLDATNVLAGSSVPGSDMDAVDGWVSARTGDAIQIHAATVIPTDGSVSFANDVAVTLAGDLRVRESGAPETVLDSTAISIGQHVVASGTLNGAESSTPSLDASNVRLMETGVSGEASSVQSGELVMSLDAIDFQSPSSFDFAGTGASIDTDADPNAYEIDTGSLALANIAPGTPLRVLGIVAPFGAAPPDFTARTVVNVADAAWRLDVAWPDGSTAAFASLEPGSIVLDLSDPALGRIHALRRGGVLTDLYSLPASPAIVPQGQAGVGIYGILQNGDVQVFLDFNRFVTELTQKLDGSTAVLRMHALGDYDAGTNTLAVKRITVQLQ